MKHEIIKFGMLSINMTWILTAIQTIAEKLGHNGTKQIYQLMSNTGPKNFILT